MLNRIYLFLMILIIGTCKADETTTPAPSTDVICKKCKCNEGLVDCSSSSITTFFNVADWSGIGKEDYKTINMSHNNFTKVTPFSNLTVVILDLSHGNINEIEKASFKYLQSMEELDMSYNNISSLTLFPDVFNGLYLPEIYFPLRSLRVLKLAYNDIHSLNSDVFEHIPQLSELHLDGNPLKMIDHSTLIAISSLSSLKKLGLSDCQLKNLPPYFLHSPRFLEWLDVSSNQFQNVPEPLEEAQALKYLDISKNPIKYIEVNSTSYTPFRRMSNLNELHLCFMPELKEIKAKSMSGLIKLSILHLNNNPALSRIDASAFESDDPDGEGKIWPPIAEMHLQRNNLSAIENTLIGRWDRLKIIDIRHNPFLCDCTTQWMVNTLALIIMETNHNYTSDIICNEPIEMRGKSMIHLEEIHNHMRCSDSYGNRPERDAALLVGTLIGALIAMPIIMGMMLLYRRGYFSCGNGGGPAAFSRNFYKRTDTNDFL